MKPGSAATADRLLLGGWIGLLALVAPARIADTDPYWQVRDGQELLAGAPLARPDTWSWAPVEGLYYPNSPAWNVALAVSWDALGWWGMYLISVLSIGACLTVVAWLARRLGAAPLVVVGTVVATSLAALPLLSPRGALPAITLMLLAIGLADVWADRASRWSPLANAGAALAAGLVLSTLGNWVHVSWSTNAIAVAAAWIAIWFLRPALTLSTRLSLAAGGALGLGAGVLLGPYGAEVRSRAATVLEASRGLITEWMSPFTSTLGLRWWPMSVVVSLLAVSAAACCAYLLWRGGRGDGRLPLASGLSVAALPYAIGGLFFVRFVAMSAVLLAPIAAVGLTHAGRWAVHASADPPENAGYLRRRLPEWTSARFLRTVMALTLVVVAPFALFLASNHARPATADINALLPEGCRQFGTPLEAASILLMRPDVPVWIDNRADYWGRERIALAQSYLYAVDQPTLAPPGTTCIVLADPATHAAVVRLAEALDADPAWRRVPDATAGALWLPADALVP